MDQSATRYICGIGRYFGSCDIWDLGVGERTTGVFACAISGALAYITYEAIERPIRRGSGSYPTRMAAFLTAAMIIVVLSGKFISRDGLPGRWPLAVQRLLAYKFDAYKEYRVGTCQLNPEQTSSAFAAECFNSDDESKKKMVLWGDSTAASLYPGLRGLNNGAFDIAQLTASGCPPFIDDYVPLAERPNCAEINAFSNT